MHMFFKEQLLQCYQKVFFFPMECSVENAKNLVFILFHRNSDFLKHTFHLEILCAIDLFLLKISGKS